MLNYAHTHSNVSSESLRPSSMHGMCREILVRYIGLTTSPDVVRSRFQIPDLRSGTRDPRFQISNGPMPHIFFIFDYFLLYGFGVTTQVVEL